MTIEETADMGFMHRVKVMLGLADDYDEYDDEYYEDDEVADEAPSRASSVPSGPYAADSSAVRRVSREPDIIRAREATPVLRSVSPAGAPSAPGAPAPQVRIHTVEPRSFSEAQSIADKFRAGQPVIMNLAVTDADLARRLLDFASGLTYGLGGGLQKVSDKVFMLSPANVDVSAAGKALRGEGSPFSME
ncbi:MAG: cell division protein SepF [Coriobacteriia bacterium]|nr:cell division protein SepF [Coriobacteriia bacterium]